MNAPKEPKWFKACAEGYMLSGTLNDICDHNAVVASKAGRNDVSIYTYRGCPTRTVVNSGGGGGKKETEVPKNCWVRTIFTEIQRVQIASLYIYKNITIFYFFNSSIF